MANSRRRNASASSTTHILLALPLSGLRPPQFSATLEGIKSRIDAQGSASELYARDNDALREQIAAVAAQGEAREAHFAAQLQKKEIEKQLLQAKSNQELEIAALKLQQAHIQLDMAKAQQEQGALSEARMKAGLASAEGSLAQYNELYKTYKETIEALSVEAKRLRDENGALSTKVNFTASALAAQNHELQLAHAARAKAEAKLEGLQKLCRALSADRASDRASLERLETQVRDLGAVPTARAGGEGSAALLPPTLDVHAEGPAGTAAAAAVAAPPSPVAPVVGADS